jgi:hypothetical protein
VSLRYCLPTPTAARPSAERWRARLYTCLIAGLLAARGGGEGGGGGDAAAGGTGPGSGTLAGAWYYDSAGKAARFDLASATEASFPLDVSSTRLLGYGGIGFTDVQEYVSTSAAPWEYVVNVRRSTTPYFDGIGELQRFSITGGFVSGPVQPSPSGVLYAVPTNESANLGAPYVDHFNLVDTKLNAVLRVPRQCASAPPGRASLARHPRGPRSHPMAATSRSCKAMQSGVPGWRGDLRP